MLAFIRTPVLLLAALALLSAVAEGRDARGASDVSLLDSTELVGDSDEQSPPTTVEAAGPVAADNAPVANAAAVAGAGNGTGTSDGLPTEPFKLPPPIFGGTQGEFVFEVTTHVANDATDATSLGESALQGVSQAPKASAHVPVEIPQEIPVDKGYRSLFDLKPLFMGIQADIHRRRALLGGVCVLSLRDLVNGVCKEDSMGADGKCGFYKIAPMSVAMQTLFNNVRTNFCKYNATGCDASMCYTYGGPVAPQTGLQQSSYHIMDDYPIWVRTRKDANSTATSPQVVAQLISFKISLEKVVFCEKIEPPQQTSDGHVRVTKCYTSRRCKMLSLKHKTCTDASSDTDPAPPVPCPTDAAFIEDVQAHESGLTSTLCSTL